ncbi:MAG: STT3 domain-containing protein [Myxococcota bacterium]|nr:STT3 domain-containing protein [Myxococcota bacterium]
MDGKESMAEALRRIWSGYQRMVAPKFVISPWLFGVLLVLAMLFSTSIRQQQYLAWTDKAETHFVGETPMVSTADAFLWVRWAREYEVGGYSQKNPKAFFPEGEFYKQPKVPLLSFLIAKAASYFDGDFYLAGTALLFLFSSLFMIPLGVYFYVAGYPGVGLLSGMMGAFAPEYLLRTSMGRIDTDMLNLFFPCMASLFIFLGARSKMIWATLGNAVLAGGSMWLFTWWYNRPGFILAYFLVLVTTYTLYGKNLKKVVGSGLVFVLACPLGNFLVASGSVQDFLQKYWAIPSLVSEAKANAYSPPEEEGFRLGIPKLPKDRIGDEAPRFNNTYMTIQETKKLEWRNALKRVHDSPGLVLFSLLGFVIFGISQFRLAVPWLPLLALGLMTFQSSRRFAMYLGPFMGMGIGFWFCLGMGALETLKGRDFGFLSFMVSRDWSCPARQSIFSLTVVVLGGLLVPQESLKHMPFPNINAQRFRDFTRLASLLPEDAAIFAWWDYGAALTTVADKATFHDPSSQVSEKTPLVASALSSSDPGELVAIANFLARDGLQGIKDNGQSRTTLWQAILDPVVESAKIPLYLYLSMDLAFKYHSIAALAEGGSTNARPRGFKPLGCNRIAGGILYCGVLKFHLSVGKTESGSRLRRITVIRHGKVVDERIFSSDESKETLLMVETGPRKLSHAFLVNETVYRSNFTQLFMLGRFDSEKFEEVLNTFPQSRVFRLKKRPAKKTVAKEVSQKEVSQMN